MREFCSVCFHPNAAPFVVPDAVWHTCVPRAFQKAELCLMCFARFADERLIPWCQEIAINPLSRVGLEIHKQQQVQLAAKPFSVSTAEV